MTQPTGNLTESYIAPELDGWEGCSHLDCLQECDTTKFHCERLARHLRIVRSNGELGGKEK